MTADASREDPAKRLMPVIRLAPAKLNLTLAVVGRRPDGYHALHSVIVPLALADRLSLAISGQPRDSVHVAGTDATWPPDRDLVRLALAGTRAAVALGSLTPTPSLAIRLEKRIPVAAGLGGGSSDAAAAIDGALEAWASPIDDHLRSHIAAAVGSDVPFFLAGGPALVEGRGEAVTPLPGPTGGAVGVLLVTPAIAVPTAEVFAAFAAIVADGGAAASPATRQSSAHLAEELRTGLTVAGMMDRAGILATANDLLGATAMVVPGLVTFRRALFRLLGRPIGQSGSGPTLWALYPSLAAAEEAVTSVRDALAAGSVAAPGSGQPAIHATVITVGGPA